MKHLRRGISVLVTVLMMATGIAAQNSGESRITDQYFHNAPAGIRQAGAGPDSELTLNGLLSEVLKNNPGLHAARSHEKSVAARIPQAGAWDDLQAGVEFYATPITSLNPITDGMETDYFLQQMIPFPGKKGSMADAARAKADMTVQSTRATERGLIAETKKDFAMLYSAQRRIEVNDENLRLLDQIIVSARSKYSVGEAAQGDVLKAQVELARLQNERASLMQEVASAAAMLNSLRNLPNASPVGKIGTMAFDSLSIPLDSLLRLSVDNRPELQGMRYEIQMNRSELSASKKEWIPDLMVKGTYKQMRDQQDQWAAMIGINIPIAPWGIGKYSGKNEENEARLDESQESLLNMKNMVQSEVRDAYAKAQSRWQQINRYRMTILPQSEQSLNASLASYRIDKVDFLSLLDSYRTLEMFRMEYYMAIGEYLVSVASLEQAVGRDL